MIKEPALKPIVGQLARNRARNASLFIYLAADSYFGALMNGGGNWSVL